MSSTDTYKISTSSNCCSDSNYYWPYYYYNGYHITPDEVRKIIREELKKFFKQEDEINELKKRLEKLENS